MSSAQVIEKQDRAACDGVVTCNSTENASCITHVRSPFLPAPTQPHNKSEAMKNAAIEMTENPAYVVTNQPVNTPASEERGTGQGQISRTPAEGAYDYVESCPGALVSSTDRDISKSIPETVTYTECI